MLPPVAPVVTITEDGGGVVDEFAERVLDYRAARVVVRIEGPCLSSCTLVTALRDRVCVGPDAVLGFHQAYIPIEGREFDASNRSDEGVHLMMRFYPPRVRDWLKRHGGLTARMIFLHGRPLRRLFHACT